MDTKTPHSHSLDALREKGHRLTPQRLLILSILNEANGHLSPVDVFERTRARMPGLTETTVYRTLEFLSSHGLVLAAHIGGGKMVYEIAAHHHHHLICRKCGGTEEILQEMVAPLYEDIRDKTGYHIDASHLVFFGVCPTCFDAVSHEGGF